MCYVRMTLVYREMAMGLSRQLTPSLLVPAAPMAPPPSWSRSPWARRHRFSVSGLTIVQHQRPPGKGDRVRRMPAGLHWTSERAQMPADAECLADDAGPGSLPGAAATSRAMPTTPMPVKPSSTWDKTMPRFGDSPPISTRMGFSVGTAAAATCQVGRQLALLS